MLGGTSMGTYIFFLVLLILSITGAVGGLFLVRKNVPVETLRSYHEVSGPLLAIVGTMYAVVLGFIVVDALNSFQKARLIVEQEANSLADVFHFADGYPDATRLQLQQCCLSYADAVVHDEWAQMEKGTYSKTAAVAIQHLWKGIIKLDPKTSREQGLYSSILTEMSTLGDSRRIRIVTAAHVFDPIIWTVLILGGVFTIVFTYFFGLESFTIQTVMTVMVTLVLCLNLFLVAMFGYPFSGDVKVFPDAFQHAQRAFRNNLAGTDEERN